MCLQSERNTGTYKYIVKDQVDTRLRRYDNTMNERRLEKMMDVVWGSKWVTKR